MHKRLKIIGSDRDRSIDSWMILIKESRNLYYNLEHIVMGYNAISAPIDKITPMLLARVKARIDRRIEKLEILRGNTGALGD